MSACSHSCKLPWHAPCTDWGCLAAADTLNISLAPDVENNASDTTFTFTLLNDKTKQLIEIGRIRTTNPSGTHGIPKDQMSCDQMAVGGGSFQEYYDGTVMIP